VNASPDKIVRIKHRIADNRPEAAGYAQRQKIYEEIIQLDPTTNGRTGCWSTSITDRATRSRRSGGLDKLLGLSPEQAGESFNSTA